MGNITPREAADSIRRDVQVKQGYVFQGLEGLEKIDDEFGSISHTLQGRSVTIYYLDRNAEMPRIRFMYDGIKVSMDCDYGKFEPQEFDNQEDAIRFVREIEKELA